MLVGLFGITNDGLNLFVNFVVVFLIAIYIALIAWTYFDARRRIEDDFLVGCATTAALFPFVGPLIYSIIRPPDFLEDARERGLEIRAAELRLRQLEEQSCPNCAFPIERTYLRCPNCRARVKDPCEECERPIDPRWVICPYCETPQRRAAPQPRRGAQEPRRAPSEQRAAGRAARPKRAPQPQGRRQPAQRPTQPRPASSRQTSPPKSRKPAPGRSSSGPTRDAPGEERPRPAPAS